VSKLHGFIVEVVEACNKEEIEKNNKDIAMEIRGCNRLAKNAYDLLNQRWVKDEDVKLARELLIYLCGKTKNLASDLESDARL